MRDRVKNLTISGRCLAGKKERKEGRKKEIKHIKGITKNLLRMTKN